MGIPAVVFDPKLFGGQQTKYSLIEPNLELEETIEDVGFVMKRYVSGSKEESEEGIGIQFWENINQQGINDLANISYSLITNNLEVIDLQFLMDEGGRVVLNDPLNLYKNYGMAIARLFNRTQKLDQVRQMIKNADEYLIDKNLLKDSDLKLLDQYDKALKRQFAESGGWVKKRLTNRKTISAKKKIRKVGGVKTHR